MRKYFTRANLGNLIGAIASIYLLIILFGVVKRNHDLQVQIDGLNAQIKSLQDQKDQLSYQIRYYQTDAFKEKEARAKLGLATPGESVVILPKDQSATANQSDETAKPKPKSHFSQWIDFLFGA
jgi:cell division protein FtsB